MNTAIAKKISDIVGKGTYVLIFKIKKTADIEIGKLGTFRFQKNTRYAYIGSAMGPGGLSARILHHINSKSLKKHWHLDYLRDNIRYEALIYEVNTESHEHTFVDALRQLNDTEITVKKFGSSDCRCESHLFKIEKIPAIDVIEYYFKTNNISHKSMIKLNMM